MKREALIVLTLTSQLGCSPDSDADAWDDGADTQAQTAPALDAGTTPASGASGDAGAASAKVGEFSLQLVAPVPSFPGHEATPGFTSLLGKVYRGALPEALIWEPKASADGCTLYTPRVPFCEEGCGTGICVEDDVCQASPATVNVGTLTVSGVRTEAGQTSFTVSPIRNNYISGAVKLPYPAWDEGAPIQMSTSGGDIAPVALASTGILPLNLTGGTAAGYPLEKGKPLALAWNKPGASSKSRIQVKLDISHHGGTKGKIDCDVDDDGELSIPASLTDALTDLGVAGFPTVMVTRSAIGSTSTSLGRIDLRVYGYVETAVVIPGLKSCTDDSECGGGQTCRDDKTCG